MYLSYELSSGNNSIILTYPTTHVKINNVIWVLKKLTVSNVDWEAAKSMLTAREKAYGAIEKVN